MIIGNCRQSTVFGAITNRVLQRKNRDRSLVGGVNELSVGYRYAVGSSGLGLAIDEFKVSDVVRYS